MRPVWIYGSQTDKLCGVRRQLYASFVNGSLSFVTKRTLHLYILDLDNNTYTRHTTESGAFHKNPDQVKSILHDPNGIIYLCEEGGRRTGVHGRDLTAKYFSILDGPGYRSETTGLAFSPDARFVLLSFQRAEVIWQFWRTDGCHSLEMSWTLSITALRLDYNMYRTS